MTRELTYDGVSVRLPSSKAGSASRDDFPVMGESFGSVVGEDVARQTAATTLVPPESHEGEPVFLFGQPHDAEADIIDVLILRDSLAVESPRGAGVFAAVSGVADYGQAVECSFLALRFRREVEERQDKKEQEELSHAASKNLVL